MKLHNELAPARYTLLREAIAAGAETATHWNAMQTIYRRSDGLYRSTYTIFTDWCLGDDDERIAHMIPGVCAYAAETRAFAVEAGHRALRRAATSTPDAPYEAPCYGRWVTAGSDLTGILVPYAWRMIRDGDGEQVRPTAWVHVEAEAPIRHVAHLTEAAWNDDGGRL